VRYTAEEQAQALTFYIKVRYRDLECQFHDDPADCDGQLECAHIIPKQTLRRNDLREFVWDPRNAILVCNKAHRRNDLMGKKFPREIFPEGFDAFIEETGMGWKLERLGYGRADGPTRGVAA
jgi:hypothetical protein